MAPLSHLLMLSRLVCRRRTSSIGCATLTAGAASCTPHWQMWSHSTAQRSRRRHDPQDERSQQPAPCTSPGCCGCRPNELGTIWLKCSQQQHGGTLQRANWHRGSAVPCCRLQSVAHVWQPIYTAVRSMAGLRSRTLVFFAESCAWSSASSNSVARSYLQVTPSAVSC